MTTESGRGRATGGRGRGRAGRGRGRGRGQGKGPRSGKGANNNGGQDQKGHRLLLLHGNRQTGDLLLGRMSSFKRKLGRVDPPIDLVAVDAPFLFEEVNEDDDAADDVGSGGQLLRTWWHRHGDEYVGLQQSLDLIQTIWAEGNYEGIIGFSQGARLAHLVALLHSASSPVLFPGLKYCIFASGYGDVPLPTNYPPTGPGWDDALDTSTTLDDLAKLKIDVPSLHVMGLADTLIPVESSKALLTSYVDPQVHEHPGGHHVPMQASCIDIYLQFITKAIESCEKANGRAGDNADNTADEIQKEVAGMQRDPDEEHAQVQQDEVESLSLIFPEEFILHSPILDESGRAITIGKEDIEAGLLSGGEGRRLAHPICYSIKLRPPPDQIDDESLWPVDENIAVRVQYPPEYPDVAPMLTLDHQMNMMQFRSFQNRACIEAIKSAAETEAGMPCVMGCVYAAREFFEGGGLAASADLTFTEGGTNSDGANEGSGTKSEYIEADDSTTTLKQASAERISECNQQGLSIANYLLGHPHTDEELQMSSKMAGPNESGEKGGAGSGGKGGQWKYTIGLVGKPSAGKSTFFNAATAFARQRGVETTDADTGLAIGGATMAPHPFTTIDPNVGFCLVPAPSGSCPEDDCDPSVRNELCVGSTHGRDSKSQRLLPVTLKDVAGLVPGAYQGRGKGNKFLDDLTDADVLIHVVDASGTADTEGNALGYVEDEGSGGSTEKSGAGSHPLDDLSWIRNELLEWVYANVSAKWESVSRKGVERLIGLFSGYRQNQAFVYDVLLEVEKYLERKEGRDHALDHLDEWDAGDVHRLVSAFLGVRFPMALALNKSDLPTAKQHVKDVQAALPVHGAHVGFPLSAKSEMSFVRNNIAKTLGADASKDKDDTALPPSGVWSTLQASLCLREPTIVFPVSDMSTYAPLAGMIEHATGHASLPNAGMVECLEAAGGEAPSLWDRDRNQYFPGGNEQLSNQKCALRDALVMKPGSTVEDAFLALKTIGALGGEFVRAEACGNIGDKPKLIKKDDILNKSNRILKIMTNKRTNWQKKQSSSTA